jgi:arylsulfatase A-like enzyme
MTARCSLLVSVLMAAGLAGCAREETAAPSPSRPNVLILVLDTTRADVFGCTGLPRNLTPRIDRLAREGVLFRRAHSTDFWTLPSHASLLTGLYPTQSQATSETNYLPETPVTLAERLRGVGYRTGAVVMNAWLSAERGFAQGFEDYAEAWREPSVSPVNGERAAAKHAAEWIEAHRAEPFLLFVNLNLAHLPYKPEPEVWESVRSRPWSAERVARMRQVVGMWPLLAGEVTYDADDFACLRELYEAEIAHLDVLVGEILDALDRSGAADRTLVVLCADHGENLGDHGLIDHLLSMYETTIHVPLILRMPGRLPAGLVREDLVSLVDVVPTALDVCRMPVDPEKDRFLGRSLADPSAPAPEFVLAENDRPVNAVLAMRSNFPRFDVTRIDQTLRTIITDRDKLVWSVGRSVALYDLRADPGETQDLSESRPERREELLSMLQRFTAVLRRGVERAEPLESRDPIALERLRGLTYIR